jgi:hypothetical protein
VEGEKLYEFLARMGRSLYTGCIFNGHSVLDIPNEGIKNTITYKFCFHSGNDKEAARMLEYLGLEVTEDNKDVIKNLKNAECLFQDLNGRVGILQFDAVFQDIIDVFTTTPSTEITKKDKEEEEDITAGTPAEAFYKKEEKALADPEEINNPEDKTIFTLSSDEVDELNIDIYAKEEID